MTRTRPTTRSIILLLAMLVSTPGVLLTGCTTNAATGRSQLNMLSTQEEIQLGEASKGQLADQYGGAVPDEKLQRYVTEIGMSMVPYTEGEYADLPWEFTLLDSDVINAFALPGGKVFLTRGLARRLKSEAELAGVLGHEIGHVTAEHADKRVSNQAIFTGVLAGAAIAAGLSDDRTVEECVPLLVGTAGTGFILKFGRDEELEADKLGMRYMRRAGYNPKAQLGVMETLRDASKGPRQWELLATHPHPERRIETIQKRLRKDDWSASVNDPSLKIGVDEYHRRMLEPVSRFTTEK